MKKQKRILIVDDEANHRFMLKVNLSDHGYEDILEAGHGQEALDLLQEYSADLILLDMKMAVMDGLTFLAQLRKRGLQTPVIVITAFSTVKGAVEAMKLGATDFLSKPVDVDELKKHIDAALQRDPSMVAAPVKKSTYHFPGVYSDKGLGAVIDLLEMVAPTDASVLILGESGTGKELVARSIHDNSPRAGAPFMAVNCAALSENLVESELFGHEKGSFTGATGQQKGRFEAAHGGTLFLDEVGELTPGAQSKLLRAIQEKVIERVGSTRPIPVDVRILAATNRNLQDMVHSGDFREDLYFRLNVFPVELPPLRERREEIPLLVKHFLASHAKRFNKLISGCSEGFLKKMQAYDFPGNVRELENLVERAIILCRGAVLEAEHLPPMTARPGAATGNGSSMKDQQKRMIQEALEKADGNKSEAARALGIARRTLHYKIKEYGLE
ncbi:sigma-54 dependent transcriptional regulator [Desulfurispirillum indicum]|uniref:Sigma-54 factor interaction domain-containing protein n=1 Tax=Desulfurispirillum indicum (strain ATCC BAA-1389 / DSM 22839 / S5) TaxID=653733 RepID=E6W102_DESIS|nr:sigma-54 dependent transcriptional regulator [Desulfurispirillum indicum]ADU65334.1 sigma-54 factor interaction domain-containing protein [Desulfurispirillum indicum S5]UCZ57230.1 sigma-54 dependent transcriptional regulator [Desulfurispirillum indicum]